MQKRKDLLGDTSEPKRFKINSENKIENSSYEEFKKIYKKALKRATDLEADRELTDLYEDLNRTLAKSVKKRQEDFTEEEEEIIREINGLEERRND